MPALSGGLCGLVVALLPLLHATPHTIAIAVAARPACEVVEQVGAKVAPEVAKRQAARRRAVAGKAAKRGKKR